MATEITSKNFDTEVLQSSLPVLVDFWASWCGPCRAIAPAVEQLSNEYQGKAMVFKLDVDASQDIAEKYGIMSIPALLVFKNGEVVDRMVGMAGKPQLAAMLDRNM